MKLRTVYNLLVISTLVFLSNCRTDLSKLTNKNRTNDRFYENRSKFEVTPGMLNAMEKYDEKTTLLPIMESSVKQTIMSEHCYKFVFNSDSSKFISFFLVRTDDSSYRIVSRINGAHLINSTNQESYPEYFAYVAIGLLHNETWYFSRHRESKFYEPNDSTAKKKYLFNSLNYYHFFGENDSMNLDFWNTTIFGIDSSTSHYYSNPFYGYPAPISSAKHQELGRLRHNAIELLKRDIPRLKSQSAFDSLKITGHYNQIDVLTDWDRILVLVPIELSNEHDEKYISFLFYTMATENPEGLIWNQNLPRKITSNKRSAITAHINSFGFDWSHNVETIDALFWTNIIHDLPNQNYFHSIDSTQN